MLTKKTIALSLSAFLALPVLFTACEDETDPKEPAPQVEDTSWGPGSNVMENYFEAKVEAATQHFSLDASTWNVRNGEKGGRYYFSPSLFVKADGSQVTGQIDVELVEIFSKSSMVALNKTTTSDGKLLRSGGEVFINVSQDGEDLKLDPNQAFSFAIPSEEDGPMQVFRGVEVDGALNWVLDDRGEVWNTLDSTIGTGSGFDVSILGDSLQWINCDVFAGLDNNTVVSITTDEGFGSLNTSCFFVFENMTSVAPAVSDSTCQCFKSYDSGLPIGEAVNIVCLSEINGQHYFYSSGSVIITDGMEVHATMNAVTESEFEAAIDAL